MNNIMPYIDYQIWDLKYRYKDREGNPIDKTFEDTWKRVANNLASIEKDKEYWSNKFFEALKDWKFIPAGRILSNAGTKRKKTTYLNCYVIPIEDSIEGIFEAVKWAALTQKQGGGVGFDFSTLRPSGSFVEGVEAKSSGPISFMRVFDATCSTIMSAGARRGAQIGVLRCDHPDIEQFIDAKKDNISFKMFNLSVAVTNEFIDAIKNNKDWELKFNGKVYKIVRALDLWNKIMQSTYDYAEPGVLFIDRINEMNNLYYCETINTVNPCGEQPLPEKDFGACLLGSINLTKFVKNPFTKNAQIDFDGIRSVVSVAVRMLDNVVDITNYPLKQQEQGEKLKRRMGIGVTGFADMLTFLGVLYGSDESCEIADKVMKEITCTAYLASVELAKEKGSFPMYDRDKYINSKFIKGLPEHIQEAIYKYGIRNSHLTSIAPTGTISLVAGNVSSGLEPIFELSYKRKYLIDGKNSIEQDVFDYAVKLYKEMHNIPLEQECELPSAFNATVKNITVKQHVDVQAAFQRWVDASCSKTINIPSDYSFDDFKEVYMYAYEKGLKGCTTYRPNPNLQSVIYTSQQKSENKVFVTTHAPKRPEILPCDIHHFKSGGKDWIALVGLLEDKPYEIFAGHAEDIKVPSNCKDAYIVKRKLQYKSKYDLYINKGKDNEIIIKDIVSQFNNDLYGSQTRLISMCLRHGAAVKFIVDQLDKDTSSDLHSFHKGIMRVLKKYISNGDTSSEVCEHCGEKQIVYESGCKTCKNCGFSKCS